MVSVALFVVAERPKVKDPSGAQEWADAGAERLRDGETLSLYGRPLAAFHLLGFAAECYAKSIFVQALGRTPAYTHQIFTLLEPAGVRRQDVAVEVRAAMEAHDPALRYQTDWPSGYSDDSVAGMTAAVTWISKVAERRMTDSARRERRR